MQNKKCYIAGKIGDLPESVFMANFEKGKKEVSELGFEPISPTDLQHNHGRTWCEYMCEDLTAMLTCSHVYALSNWRHSPGATIEVELALKVGINVIHQPVARENKPVTPAEAA